MTKTQAPRGSSAVNIVIALVLGTSTIVLFAVLSTHHRAGRAAIDAYVDSIRGGVDVAATEGGSEAPVITTTLRQSATYAVSNFQSQHGTSCFWLTLRGSGGLDTDAQVVLVESSGKNIVSAISLTRSCDCPDDASEPCHLD